MVYRRRSGSGPVEQRKQMDLDWKSNSATAFGAKGFLQLADTAPNVGAKSGRREEGRGMTEPRDPWGVYIGGGGVDGHQPLEETLGHHRPHQPPPAP
jgi:alpha-L-arabinofuranosidase